MQNLVLASISVMYMYFWISNRYTGISDPFVLVNDKLSSD